MHLTCVNITLKKGCWMVLLAHTARGTDDARVCLGLTLTRHVQSRSLVGP